MRFVLFAFTIYINFSCSVSLLMHEKGPTHRKQAVACIEDIIREQFYYRSNARISNHTKLFTVLVTTNISSPAFEIQETILKKINDMANWYLIEVVSLGRRYEFQSYAKCSEDECVKSFIIDFKSNFYFFIINSRDSFSTIIKVLEESNTFNPKAYFLVYIEHHGSKYREVADRVLRQMRQRLLVKTTVLIPKTLQTFNLYKLSTATRGPYKCESNFTVYLEDQCVKGRMLNKTKRYYKYIESTDMLNCSIGVIAKHFRPFVINSTYGFEIELLQTIAKVINVYLNITVDTNATSTWGEQSDNGTWTGNLKFIFEDYYLGVGNVETSVLDSGNFTLSRFYHMEPLVVVVPIAKFLPKWQMLVAIFTPQMWGICLGIILFFGISFYFASKVQEEDYHFNSIGECIFQSFTVIISIAPALPKRDLTRVFFASLGVISIILASAYTCSLVYYMKNPIRERQATNIGDIMNSFGVYEYKFGGVSRYKQLFVTSSEDEGTELYYMYETAPGENNTIIYWLGKVADERNVWTVSSELFVNYLLGQRHKVVTDENGKPKIYVFKEHLMSYSVNILLRNGNFLLRNIDRVIQKLTWGGIISRMSAKYIQDIAKKNTDNTLVGDDNYQPLSLDNFQGAFALLIFGYVVGFSTLFIEYVVKRYRKRKNKRKLLHWKSRVKNQ